MTGFRRLALFSALILLILLLTACGRKTDPIPPQAAIPAAVSDLSYRFSGSEVVLEWTYPENSIDGQKIEKVRRFIIRKSDLAGENYCPDCPSTVTSIKEIEPLSTGPGQQMEARDEHLVPGHHYSYTVISDCGWNIISSDSNRISFWWLTPPAAPAAVQADDNGRGAEIFWQEVQKDITGAPLGRRVRYQIYRKSGTGRYRFMGETEGTTYYDQIPGAGNFLYRVRAIIEYKGTVLPGPFSETIGFTPVDRTAPPVPEIISVIPSNRGPRLLWEKVSAPDLAGYRIYRRKGDSQEWHLIAETGPHAFSFTDGNLSGREGKWYYRISSFDQASPANESDYSPEAGFR